MDTWDDDCQAYLLRLWPVSHNGKTTWRASLQPVGETETRGFESLDDLFAYLRATIEAPPGAVQDTLAA